MSSKIRLNADDLRSIAFGSIGAGYSVVGSVFTHDIRMLFVQNLTNEVLTFSFNGNDDHLELPANGHFSLDVSTNKASVAGDYIIPAGKGIFVKQSGVPTSGSVYVTAFYSE